MPLGIITIKKRSGDDGNIYPVNENHGPVMLGNSDENDIRIKLPSVSKLHCKIEFNESKEARLVCLSTNVGQTQVNGQFMDQGSSEMLYHQAIFTVGDRSFRWEYPNDSALIHRRSNDVLNSPRKTPTPKVLTPNNGKTKDLTSKSSIETPSVASKAIEAAIKAAIPSPRVLQTPKSDAPIMVSSTKRVSFGPYVSPEIIDKELPPSTPVKKGAEPLNASLDLNLLSNIKSPKVMGTLNLEDTPSTMIKSKLKKKIAKKPENLLETALQDMDTITDLEPLERIIIESKSEAMEEQPTEGHQMLKKEFDENNEQIIDDCNEQLNISSALKESKSTKATRKTEVKAPIEQEIASLEQKPKRKRAESSTPPAKRTRTRQKEVTVSPPKSEVNATKKTSKARGARQKPVTESPMKSVDSPKKTPKARNAKAKSVNKSPVKSDIDSPKKTPKARKTRQKSVTKSPVKEDINSPKKTPKARKTRGKPVIKSPGESDVNSPNRTTKTRRTKQKDVSPRPLKLDEPAKKTPKSRASRKQDAPPSSPPKRVTRSRK